MGVPKKYKHDWKYKGRWRETKVSPGKWKGTFTASKTRSKGAKGMGSIRKGNRIKWRIQGTQTARKVSKNTYHTKFRFTKKFVHLNRR